MTTTERHEAVQRGLRRGAWQDAHAGMQRAASTAYVLQDVASGSYFAGRHITDLGPAMRFVLRQEGALVLTGAKADAWYRRLEADGLMVRAIVVQPGAAQPLEGDGEHQDEPVEEASDGR